MNAGDMQGAARTQLRYPDFLGIGAQKAGTTWLHRKLSSHPKIWLPPAKELHFFDALHLNYPKDAELKLSGLDQGRMEHALRQIDWVLKGRRPTHEKLARIHLLSLIGTRTLTDEWYGRIFQSAPDDALCGEITPEYALLPEQGISHITRLQPDIKIFFILRDPIERGWSDIRMMQRKTNTIGVNEVRRISGTDFLARSDYAATIERFRHHVGSQDILILYFDDIAENPGRLLKRLYDFLGVEDVRINKLDEPAHQGQHAELDVVLYEAMRERLKPVYDRLLSLDTPTVRRWYHKHYG